MYLNELTERYPSLTGCIRNIQSAYCRLVTCFNGGGRLYVCGNGGSAADALHFVGELTKSFVLPRSVDQAFEQRAPQDLCDKLQGALPAFALVENVSLASAFSNDVDAEYVFAQQVYAYARERDCVFGISTSGNSSNILKAIEAAKGRGSSTICLTGMDGGALKGLCDISIIVPEAETYKIQELHLPIYHTLCLMLEEHFWGSK